mmetsp:Transcript_4506/g.11516  ORF Transcript_4506/g.11516 Transcript_4506/m.11516 type:complete len:504 (-) Transcript_4506:322-1833(-)
MEAGRLTIATWNVAAINNNPFEQRIKWDDDPRYDELMRNVELFIDNPGDLDVSVETVLTQEMFGKLMAAMKKEGWPGLDKVRQIWEDDYKDRMIVSGFLLDKVLGKKRLVSMPDRVTNTVQCADGSRMCRPTIINAYDGDLPSVPAWFEQWLQFMFHTTAETFGNKGVVKSQRICQMLMIIKKSKYPDITEEEEAISLALQTVALAVFDAVMVHMVNTLARSYWYEIKMGLFKGIYENKSRRILDILATTYDDSDIICLQEAAASFIPRASESPLNEKFHIVVPEHLDGARNQNSFILLNRARFAECKEVTKDVLSRYAHDLRLDDGDLFALSAKSTDGTNFMIASFHGDTNGIASTPVVEALMQCHMDLLPDHIPIFGIDANTHADNKPKTKAIDDFFSDLVKLKLESCFRDAVVDDMYTTFSARTFLQPQFQKATRSVDVQDLADHNPKDHILFRPDDFEVEVTARDNTGLGKFVAKSVFPTIEFPSDHAVVLCTLRRPAK